MKNVLVIDIDGVLADYRLGLLYWIRQSCPELSQAANKHIQRTDTWIDAESMGVSYRKWLDVLEMFRMSGGKQSIPVFEGAKYVLGGAKLKGWEVVLLTSRPIDIYSNIYRDTVEWLRNNHLPYDVLLWSKSKAEMIYKMRLTDKIIYAIDDEWRHIEDYDKLGIPTIWIDLYNTKQGLHLLEQCMRVNSLEEALEILKEVAFNEPTKSNST